MSKSAILLNETIVAVDDFQFTYAILNKAGGEVIETIQLNVYKDLQDTDMNESGQLLYHWDDNDGSSKDHIWLVLDAYKASYLWGKYPLRGY